MVAQLARVLALSLATLPLGAALVAADDGPPRLLSATGQVRPQETVSRIVNSRSTPLVVLLAGYATDAYDARDAFSGVVDRLSDHDVRFFIEDVPYDTRGSAKQASLELIEYVRRQVREEDYAQVHTIGHSAGAFTLDRAFAAGLGARDNVVSYTALSAPHRGSMVALTAVTMTQLAGPLRGEVTALMRLSGGDPDDPAVRELARRWTPAAPEGVRTRTITAANDLILFPGDSPLPGADNVTLLVGGLDGHGAMLTHRRALEQIEANVRGTVAERPWWEEPVARIIRHSLEPAQGGLLVSAAAGIAWASRWLYRLR